LTTRFSIEGKNSNIETVYNMPRQFLIDEWRLGELLGSGSFSQVYMMTPRKGVRVSSRKSNHGFGVTFVGKFINGRPPATKKTFLQEAKLLHTASDRSKHIVDIFGIVLKPQIIIMKYYWNGSLDRALLEDFNRFGGGDGGEFPTGHRLRFIYHLCLAVNTLHNIGIVHRDIASRNLLLSDNRESVVLADFGLARQVKLDEAWNDNVTETAIIPRTSPPETWLKSPVQLRKYGLKTDTWSVGMTMFEIINMRPITAAFREMKIVKGTKALVPKNLLLEDTKIGKSFNRHLELWTIILRCLNVKPEMRPHIWEVEMLVKNLIRFPLGCKDINYFSKWRDNFNDHNSPDIADLEDAKSGVLRN